GRADVAGGHSRYPFDVALETGRGSRAPRRRRAPAVVDAGVVNPARMLVAVVGGERDGTDHLGPLGPCVLDAVHRARDQRPVRGAVLRPTVDAVRLNDV